jgi:hypothetical protein
MPSLHRNCRPKPPPVVGASPPCHLGRRLPALLDALPPLVELDLSKLQRGGSHRGTNDDEPCTQATAAVSPGVGVVLLQGFERLLESLHDDVQQRLDTLIAPGAVRSEGSVFSLRMALEAACAESLASRSAARAFPSMRRAPRVESSARSPRSLIAIRSGPRWRCERRSTRDSCSHRNALAPLEKCPPVTDAAHVCAAHSPERSGALLRDRAIRAA